MIEKTLKQLLMTVAFSWHMNCSARGQLGSQETGDTEALLRTEAVAATWEQRSLEDLTLEEAMMKTFSKRKGRDWGKDLFLSGFSFFFLILVGLCWFGV